MATNKKKIGELLLEAGLIDEFKLKSALSYQSEWGGRIGSILIKKGFVTEEGMKSVIEKQLGLKCLMYDTLKNISREALNMVKLDIARKYAVFPAGLEGNTLIIAMSDPTDLKAADEIGFLLGRRIKPVLALESDIVRAIEEIYEGKTAPGKTHRIDTSRIPVQESTPVIEKPEEEQSSSPLIHEHKEIREPAGLRQKKEISQKMVLETLVDLLVAKGVFTKEEFIRAIKAKQ